MKHDEMVKKFTREHPNAEACPNCNYKYYATPWSIDIAYEVIEGVGYCRVCHEDPDFPHKYRPLGETTK